MDQPYALAYWSEGKLCYGCAPDGYALAMGRVSAERLASGEGPPAVAVPYWTVPERLQTPELKGGPRVA